MRFRGLATLGLICLLLAGCGSDSQETTLSTTTAQTMPTETIAPTTEATVPPTTEPELDSGMWVVADGDKLESGSVLFQDVTYVKAAELLDALDEAEYQHDEAGIISFVWKEETYTLTPRHEGLVRNGRTLVLASPVLTWHGSIWVPLEELCGILNIATLPDPEQETLYCTASASDWQWAEGIRVPILMYHGVTDDTWGFAELFVSPSDLEAQIQYLVENGYDTITFEDWSHLEDFDKPVMLTFDDGYLDNYEELFPILQKYNAKATIFAITYSVDRDARTITSEQAREMMASGLVSIQSHTYNHPHLSECSAEELEQQMSWSKLHVARMTGYIPFVVCYPYGDSDAEAREFAAEYYNFGLNMNGGLYTTSDDVFRIPRYYVSRYTSLYEFIDMVDDAGR